MSAIAKVVAIVIALCLLVASAVAGGVPAAASDHPSPVASSTIPGDLLALFRQASAASDCGVPWTLVAAVAYTESDFDPTATSSAGAEGLFQFEPATFAAYDTPVPAGGAVPPTPFDPTDATTAAARYLCSLGIVANPTSALVAYNCGNSAPACQAASAGYAEQVLATAASYTATGTSAGAGGVPTGVEMAAVAYAESQIGTPYVWGGTSPKTGFDCSGLVVWAYGVAGVVVPRVANDQWQDEPHVAMDQLVPGDLVFFGSGTQTGEAVADHVGIYIGNSAMVDAPYTGADVRIDTIPMTARAAWGNEIVLGAADPVAASVSA